MMSLITSVAEANDLRRSVLGTERLAEKTAAASGLSGNNAERTGSATSAESFRDVLGGKLRAVSESMDDIFEEAAARYGLSSKLLKAVAKAESNFNPRAVSRAGAVGVMQLMPGTARNLGVSDPYDARQNIMGGAKYLKENLDKFGDVRLALAAYNAGPNAVQKYGGVPPYSETQGYVKKIMSYLGGDTLYANRTVNTGGSKSQASTAAQLYTLSRLGSASGLGSLDGSSGSSSDTYSLNGLSGLTGLYGLGGSGGSYDLYGLSGGASSWLSGLSLGDDGETMTMDMESYRNLIEILRIQMMMNASREVGALRL